jgi:hypothetical protein
MKKLILILLLLISLSSYSQNIITTNGNQSRYKGSKKTLEDKGIRSDPVDSLINLCISEINQDSIKSYIQHLQNFGTRYLLAPNHKDIALWLQNKFISLGYTNTVLDSFIMVTNLPNSSANDTSMQYNVIATNTGNVNPNNVYIIGGHYDDITNVDPMNYAPGADDDASGIAAAIEIARVLKKIGYSPESTIKFVAFAGEEAMVLYADEWGSHHYAMDAINNNENIIFFITNDMIANNTDSINWKIKINYHTTSGVMVQFANELCQEYTCLTPVNVFNSMNNGADDYSFARAGIPALFMEENNFSPYYHSESDTLGKYNMDYCAEVTKVSAGMLIKGSDSPFSIKNYFIINPGDGYTLEPSWKPNNDVDLAGYKVYIGKSPGVYDTVIVANDTSYIFSNLLTDTLYYIGVSAFDSNGNESLIIEKSDAPGLVTLSQGILIVKDSKGGFLNPTEQQVDDFYNQVCFGFNHSQYDATATNKISLDIIGKYSSILWYMNNKSWTASILKNYTDVLRNYLNLGGHILFTLYKPSTLIENNTENSAVFKEGSFIYDCANISGVNDTLLSKFCAAIPVLPNVDSMFVDSLKMLSGYYNYHLPNIEVFSPTQNGNILYLFDSKWDSTTVQGCFINRPVGIENKGADKNIVTLSFPLYYMKTDLAQAFVYHVMADEFHENYTGIIEAQQNNNSDIIIYPNPTADRISIISPENQNLNLSLYNIVGELVIQRKLAGNTNEVDVSSLSKGVYIVKVSGADWTVQKKLVKE